MDKQEIIRQIGREMRKHEVSYNALSVISGVSRSTIMRIIKRVHKNPEEETLLAMQKGLKQWKKANGK